MMARMIYLEVTQLRCFASPRGYPKPGFSPALIAPVLVEHFVCNFSPQRAEKSHTTKM
jgi:hypothetical protein